jgi:large repetitive protein
MTMKLYAVPADTSASIVPGGAAVTVMTTTPGQNAKVTFTGAGGQRVFLKLSGVTIAGSTCCSAKVSILKPDGTALVAATNVGTSGGFLDTKSLPVAGTYTILVDPQSTATGGMTLTLYDVPPDPTATTTPGGSPVTVATTTPGQNAKVTFEGVAGRQVSLRIGWTPSVCCLTKVSITSPDGGTVLAPFSVGATGAFIDAKMLPVSGTYTILVDPQGSAAGTTTLTLYDVPPDVTAPITPGGPAVTLTTTADGQNARFTFPAAAGDGALVTVGPNCCATNVSILKPDGVAVASPVALAAAGGTLTARLPVSGTYTILVDLQGQATGSVTVRLQLDSSAPAPPVLTITEASANSHGNGATFYYRPAGTGSTFTVNAATSDAGTGVQKVTFPGLSGGFTPTITTSDSSSPYSQVYTWATGATFSSTANTVTVYDNVGNTSSAKFAIVPDSTPPATTDNTGSIGSAWKNTTQTVTLVPADAASGVAATHYTTNGSTPTTGSAQGTLVTLSADGVYTVKYFSVDNVGNAEPVQTAGTQIRVDKTSPTATTTFPGAQSYNAAGWNAGCAAAGFCGTASDALSGVQKVELSIRQGSGNYWDGSAFASPSEVFLPAAGTTAWSYGFAAAAFPADGSYTVRVQATDNATNVGTPVSRTFTYDTVPADTTITAAPANPSNSSSASFSFSASEAGSTFACSLDGAAFTACASPKSYTGLAGGAHSFQVRATDPAGNTDSSPANHSWTIDLTAPETTISSGPPTSTNQTSASFSFTSSEAGSTFQCSLDGAAFAACTSPKSYSGLAGGSHTFRVRAIDPAGNTDASPATQTWTVDLTAPQTTISTGPATFTNSTNASFTFASNEPFSSFECSLDGGPFVACTSPKPYSGLAEGAHSFQVRATDPAGNTDATPATHSWTIDLVAPDTTITAGPPSPSNSASASFSFSSTEAGSTFQCSLDAGAFLTCTSPKTYTGLTAGTHSFRVRAIDAAGNLDASAASYGWTIDLTAPETTIGSGPATPTTETSASFSFSASEAGSGFACSLDGAAFAPCTSPESYSGLGEGAHSFQVRATDPAGNTDASPASYGWTVDLSAPQTTLDAAPADPTNATSASFAFSASEPGSSFECALDGGAYAPCTSPAGYSGLGEGAHSFAVRASDPAGNTDASPAGYGWTVDLSAPAPPAITAPAGDAVTNNTTVTLAGTADPGTSVELFDGASSVGTTPADITGAWTLTLTSVAEGAHGYTAKASDAAGNTSSGSNTRTITVDTSAPQTTLDAAPADPTNATSASFAFSASEPGSSFECALDGAAFATCTSPQGYSGIAEGAHTFQVRGTDAAGNTDTTPASYGWTVDLTAPETTITSGPASSTNATSASFGFSANEASTFECSLDGAAFATCTSPEVFSGLAEGAHGFEVRATDSAGNTDATAASRGWTVDLTAPSAPAISDPPDDSTTTSATVTVAGIAEPGAGVELFDGATSKGVTTADGAGNWGKTLSLVADGLHTYTATATDAAGNTSASSNARSVTVDTTAPTTTITAGPSSSTNVTSASFSFGANEASTFECSLDGAAFATCTSPQEYTAVTEGAHTFEVRATDSAGNTDATPASFGWTVDLTAPETTISSGPPDPTAETSASFMFSSTEAGSTFECSLDGAAFAPCTSGQSYTDLAPGSHSFEVKATDPAANADVSPASYAWTVA